MNRVFRVAALLVASVIAPGASHAGTEDPDTPALTVERVFNDFWEENQDLKAFACRGAGPNGDAAVFLVWTNNENKSGLLIQAQVSSRGEWFLSNVADFVVEGDSVRLVDALGGVWAYNFLTEILQDVVNNTDAKTSAVIPTEILENVSELVACPDR